MPKQIIWSPAAESDLENILTFLELKWSSRIVSRFLNRLDDCIYLISEDHKLFPIINKDIEIRKCVVSKQNTLYYRAKDNKIELVRLFDSRQDPEKLKFK